LYTINSQFMKLIIHGLFFGLMIITTGRYFGVDYLFVIKPFYKKRL
jgi:hypothetical protein